MPTWRLEVGDKSYDFNPEKDYTLADWERMEDAYGEDLGGWFSFRNLLYKGSHKVARCLIWGARRKAGERVSDDPRMVELPSDFEMGVFFESVTNQDIEQVQKEAAKEAATPDPLESGSSPEESNPDGSDPSPPSDET